MPLIKWKNSEFRTVSVAFIFLGIHLALPIYYPETAYAQTSQSQTKNRAVDELIDIGKKIAQGILTKDIELILHYDRPDLAQDDRNLLRNKRSDLYCYLFDSSCITWKGRSVYDILREAHQLFIAVKDLGKDKDGIRYGLLYFYDGSIADERRLFSPDYLCEKGGKEVVTWTFRRIKGKWESAHPPFDAETNVYCNP